MNLHKVSRQILGSPARRLILAVVTVAVIVRAVYLASYLQSPLAGLWRADQRFYRDWALRILSGDLIGDAVFEQGPFYAYWLAAMLGLLGRSETAVLILQTGLGVVTAALTCACGMRLWGRTAGTVAGLAAATYGPLVFYEVMLMKSFLSPLFTMLALSCALRYADHRRLAWMIAATVAVVAATLDRENHALLLLPLLVWGIFVDRQAAASRTSIALRAAAVLAVFAAGILPVTIRNAVVGREVVAVTSGGGEVFYMAWGPWATGYYHPPPFIRPQPKYEHADFRHEAARRLGHPISYGEASRFWAREAAREIARDPSRAVGLVVSKGLILVNDFEVPDSESFEVTRRFLPLLRWLPTWGLFLGLGVVGAIVAWRRGREGRLVLAFLAMHVLGILLTYNFGRFRIGLVPLWLLLAGAAVAWVIERIRASRGTVSVGVVAAVAVALLLPLAAFLPPFGYADTNYAEEAEAFTVQLQRRGETLARAESLRAHVAADPSNPAARYELGVALASLGRLDEAAAQLARAAELDPDSIDIRREYGVVLAQRGDTAAAVAQFEALLQLDPASAAAHLNLGSVAFVELERTRDPDERRRLISQARHHSLQALELEPRSALAHFHLARLALLERETVRARRHLEHVLELEPENVAARQLLQQLQFAGAER